MSQDGARFARRNRSVGSGVDGGTWREANIKKNWVYRAYFKLTKQFTETPLLLHPTALIGSPNRKKCSHCHQISVRHVNCGQWWHISSPQLRTLSQFEVYKWFYRNGETKLIFAVFLYETFEKGNGHRFLTDFIYVGITIPVHYVGTSLELKAA